MPREGAPASSFSVDGQLELRYFASTGEYHTYLDGERIETLVARMMGFPSDNEVSMAMDSGVSPDPSNPDITRMGGRVSMSMYLTDDNGTIV